MKHLRLFEAFLGFKSAAEKREELNKAAIQKQQEQNKKGAEVHYKLINEFFPSLEVKIEQLNPDTNKEYSKYWALGNCLRNLTESPLVFYWIYQTMSKLDGKGISQDSLKEFRDTIGDNHNFEELKRKYKNQVGNLKEIFDFMETGKFTVSNDSYDFKKEYYSTINNGNVLNDFIRNMRVKLREKGNEYEDGLQLLLDIKKFETDKEIKNPISGYPRSIKNILDFLLSHMK